MEILTLNLTAGVTQQFRRGGVGLEILSSTAAIDLNTYSPQGGQSASMTACLGGQFINGVTFGGFDVKSTTTQTVRLLVLDAGEGGGSRNVALNGNLNLGTVPATQSNAFVNTNRTVTSTSTAVLGGNSARQYLLIQNKDSTGTIWVAFGAAATQANGLRIPPGGYWEWDGTVPVSTVNVIGDLATQSNVITIEG